MMVMMMMMMMMTPKQQFAVASYYDYVAVAMDASNADCYRSTVLNFSTEEITINS